MGVILGIFTIFLIIGFLGSLVFTGLVREPVDNLISEAQSIQSAEQSGSQSNSE